MSDDLTHLIAEATLFVERWTLSPRGPERFPREQGATLAQRLRGAAIDLSCNKATEYSPDIRRCTLLAAQAAWLSLEPADPMLSIYERDLFYYPASDPIVADYERFKARHRSRSR